MIDLLIDKINKKNNLYIELSYEMSTQNNLTDIVEKVKNGKVDLIYITPYLLLRLENILNHKFHMLTCNAVDGKSFYNSVLFSFNKNTSLTDKFLLENKPIVYWGNKNSTSGFQVPSLVWKEKFDKLNLHQVNLKNHDDVAYATHENNTSIGVIHKNILENISKQNSYNYNILWTSNPIPHGGIVLNSYNNEKSQYLDLLKKEFSSILLSGNIKLDKKIDDVNEISSCSRNSFDSLDSKLGL